MPEFECLGGAEPEQVVIAAAHQLGRGRAVVGRGQSANHRHRNSRELALHQVGGRGDLIGHRHLGDKQFVAVRIKGAGIGVEHRHPCRPDRRVGLPVAPGSAHRVGDHDADFGPRAKRRTQSGGATVRVDRK